MQEHGENSSQALYFVRNSETLPSEMVSIIVFEVVILKKHTFVFTD